jgi:hypothetical protein
MRRIALVALLASVTASGVPAAAAKHDTFTGTCNVRLVSVGSYTSTAFTFTGTGTCTGRLNGVTVGRKITLEGHGDGHYFVVPLIFNGFATARLGRKGPVFPLAFDQLAAVLHVFGLCDGCGGHGLGVAEPYTEEQPADQTEPTQVFRLVVSMYGIRN